MRGEEPLSLRQRVSRIRSIDTLLMWRFQNVFENRKLRYLYGQMFSEHKERVLDLNPGMDLLLGFVSVPFTLALSPDPSTLTITPVLVSGFVCGLYYGTKSKSVRRAGSRTGLIGGLPVFWSVVDLVSTALSVSLDSLPIAILGGSLLIVFVLTISAALPSFCAILGGWVANRWPW